MFMGAVFYLHSRAVALVCVGKPAITRGTLVHIKVLYIYIHTDHLHSKGTHAYAYT